jgi:hypothetical protein
MQKLKYRLKDDEKIVYDLKDMKDYELVVAVVRKKPITEKELVKKVKKTNKTKK